MNRIFLISFIFNILFSQDRGIEFYNNNNYENAKEFYQNVIDHRKDDLSALYGLGVTAYKQEDLEKAIDILSKVKNSDNKELASKASYNLGNILKEQNQFEESLKYYENAIKMDPNDNDSKINYELLKIEMQQQENEENSKGNKDQEKEENGQNSEGSKDQEKEEDGQNSEGDRDQDQADNEQNPKENEDQKDSTNSRNLNQKETKEFKSDQLVQAEAILNALRDQEKINQKQKIKKTLTRNLGKDW